MPPLSYVISAVVLIALVVASVPPTMGFSLLLWYWVFLAAGWLFMAIGTLRTTRAIQIPTAAAIVLLLPGLVWAFSNIIGLVTNTVHGASVGFQLVTNVAPSASGAGAVYLMERLLSPRRWLRALYSIPLAAGILILIFIMGQASGWSIVRNPTFAIIAIALGVVSDLVTYTALATSIGVLVLREKLEYWILIVTALVCLLIGFGTLEPIIKALLHRDIYIGDRNFWLQPIITFVWGIAILRLGTLQQALARDAALRDRQP